MAGQLVRVVAWRARHREDAAGLGLHDHDRAVVAAEQLVGECLQRRVDRGLDRRAGVLRAGEHRLELVPQQGVRVAAEQRVAGVFDAAVGRLIDRVVAGDGGVHRAVRVFALVLERVVGRGRLGQHGAVGGEDRAAMRAVRMVYGACVARIGVEGIGLYRGPDRGGQAEDDEQHDHRGEKLTQGLVHCTPRSLSSWSRSTARASYWNVSDISAGGSGLLAALEMTTSRAASR